MKNVRCQRESQPLHLLRHGMVGFGVGLNLGSVYVVTEKNVQKLVNRDKFPYVPTKCFCSFQRNFDEHCSTVLRHLAP